MKLSNQSLGDFDHSPEPLTGDPGELRERLKQIRDQAKAIRSQKAKQKNAQRFEKLKGTAAEPGDLKKRVDAKREAAQNVEIMRPFRHQTQLIQCVDKYRNVADFFLVGGYGCVSGDTLLTTPDGPKRIDQFQGGEVLTFNEETGRTEWAVGGVAIDYPATSMYRITTESGHTLDCTGNHKIMTRQGWKRALELSFGEDLLVQTLPDGFSPSPPATTSDTCLSGLHEGEHHCSRTPEGSRDDYLAYLRSGDVLPLSEEGSDQASSRPQVGADGHSRHCCSADDHQPSQECSHACPQSDPKPRTHSFLRSAHPVEALGGCASASTSEQPSGSFQQVAQSLDCTDPEGSTLESSQQQHDQSVALFYSPVASVQPIGEFVYYDLTVPSNHTYIANGIVSHNCGKSFSMVLLILSLVEWYNFKSPVTIGLGSPTITFFRKTVWLDLEKILITTGSKYSYDQQQNRLQIGSVSFQIVPTEQPSTIFGFNYSAFICDELDELPQDKAIEAYGAITERTRVQFPPVTPEEWHYAIRFKELMQSKTLWAEKFTDCGAPDGQGCLHTNVALGSGYVGGGKMMVSPGEKKSFLCNRHELEEAQEKKGRTPFRVFVTTAQGYRGTYQITEDLKEKDQPFVLIRGLTKDNTANSRSYYLSLLALYNENERRAFLEGEFVNLSSGRVYPDYDASRHDVKREDGKALFELAQDDHVFCGQDLNVGHAKCVAGVERDGKFYIVKTFSFKAISDAPFILRNTFPTQKITMYPDASAKEVISGYAKEFREKNIEVRFSTQNPSVIDRIFLVNKMFKTDRLFLFAGTETRPLQMALKTRQFDDNGKPEKGKGENAPDHLCDGLDYLIFRMVQSSKSFYDLYKLTRSGKVGEENPEGRVWA